MTLAQLMKVAHVPATTKFHWWCPTIRAETWKKHARLAWRGKAHLEFNSDVGRIYIVGDGIFTVYATSFEDFTADDWELVE